MKERTVQHDKRITPRTAKRLLALLICALPVALFALGESMRWRFLAASVAALPLVTRLGAAAALATVNPLAGLLPLIDPGARFGGQGRGALQDVEVCRVLTSGQTPPVAHVGHG